MKKLTVSEHLNNNKKAGKWVPLCCILGALWITIIYYRSVKFESNDSYDCIRKTILNEEICQPKI